MYRKEYLIKIEPVGHEPSLFHIKEPKKEQIVLYPLGKYIRIEDSNSLFVIKSDYYNMFLDGKHNFKGHISLSPKTMNIVQQVEAICSNPACKVKKLKYVIKSGTAKRVEKEFNNYINMHRLAVNTLYPIGYVLNKSSDPNALSFHFTKFEIDTIPLSVIDYSSLLREDREYYLRLCAETMATIHFYGYTHNDPKLKNFLLDKRRDKLLLIDLVKMNYSKTPLILNLEHRLSSPAMQALRYDFLNFLGNAVYSKMIVNEADVVFFLKNYIKKQYSLSENRTKKGKPHELSLFISDLSNAILLHNTDKNIMNITSLLNAQKEANNKKDGCNEQEKTENNPKATDLEETTDNSESLQSDGENDNDKNIVIGPS